MGTDPEFKTMLEDEARDALFNWLRASGHTIDHERWPDRERMRQRPQLPGKTVDLTFTEDGHPVAVEITELHQSGLQARTMADIGDFTGRLERELRQELKEPETGTIAVSIDFGWFPKRAERDAAFQRVKSQIVSAVTKLEPGESFDIEQPPNFVRSVSVTCFESPTPKVGVAASSVDEPMYMQAIGDLLAEALLDAPNKPEQLAAYDDARILAIDRDATSYIEFGRALEARSDRIPGNWTAIYYVAGKRLAEAWSRRATRVDPVSGRDKANGSEDDRGRNATTQDDRRA